MEKLHDAVAFYQKKIGSYDKQLWEQSVEQRILLNIQHVPKRTARQKTELIDVDLVRGSTFSKAKPQVSWTHIAPKAVIRVLFFPFFYKWWLQHMTTKVFLALLMLYLLQLGTAVVFFRTGACLLQNEDTASEVVIPGILMFILGQIHAQAVLAHVSHRVTHRDQKNRESKAWRRQSYTDFKKSQSFPNQSLTSQLEKQSRKSTLDASKLKEQEAANLKFKVGIAKEKISENLKSLELDLKASSLKNKKKQQSRTDIQRSERKKTLNVNCHLHQQKSVSWSDAYSAKSCPYPDVESADTDVQSDEESHGDKHSEKYSGSDEENSKVARGHTYSLPDLLSSDVQNEGTTAEHVSNGGLTVPSEHHGRIHRAIDVLFIDNQNVAQDDSDKKIDIDSAVLSSPDDDFLVEDAFDLVNIGVCDPKNKLSNGLPLDQDSANTKCPLERSGAADITFQSVKNEQTSSSSDNFQRTEDKKMNSDSEEGRSGEYYCPRIKSDLESDSCSNSLLQRSHKNRNLENSTGASSSDGETGGSPDGSKLTSSEAEWVDQVPSDMTSSTYSSSTENDLSGNETQDITEENMQRGKGDSREVLEQASCSHAHINNPLQPMSSSAINLGVSQQDKVSCVIWEDRECKKIELTALDIGWTIIEKVDSIPESSDYIWVGISCSLTLAFVPFLFRAYHAKENPAIFSISMAYKILNYLYSNSWRLNLIMVNGILQRFFMSGLFFFMLSVADRTFKQRVLYAKHFCYLTSSRRAKKFDMPHFRLNKVRNIKTWLSLRSYLKKRGPQRSIDVIVSATCIITVILLTLMSLQLLKDAEAYLDFLCNWELMVWCLALGLYLLRFMTLGMKVNKKYRNLSVLITEQINLYLQMEQKPHKKEELMVANNVLKLAEDLLKELESPFKISGMTANPLFYNVTKVVVLSAFSAVLTELLGFKLKLYKIKLKA